MDETYVEKIPEIVARLRKSFRSGTTRPVDWRRSQLEALRTVVTVHKTEICEALKLDLGRDEYSTFISELSATELEIQTALSNLSSWMKPEPIAISFVNKPGSAKLVHEPLGVVLIMSAWNFPVLTLLQPAVGAIAAGNAVVLKPSSLASNTSVLIARLVEKYMHADSVAVVEGGVNSGQAVLKERFDKIMYTGGAGVGRIVMEAASKHLTPVSLELGGKNPCVITKNTSDLKVAVRRMCWAKFAVNAGQVCISPDYLLVDECIGDQVVELMKHTLAEFFGVDCKKSPAFSRIINANHAGRLQRIAEADKDYVVHGGEVELEERFVAPTIVNFKTDQNAFKHSKCMQDEIFGPILPILYFKNVEEAVTIIGDGEKPLAFTVFGSPKDGEMFVNATSSGSLTVNDCIMQKGELGIPFGGVGHSGFGRYHGKYSFTEFSHAKPVLQKTLKHDLDARYPPYTDSKKSLFENVHQVLLGNKGMIGLGFRMIKYNMTNP